MSFNTLNYRQDICNRDNKLIPENKGVKIDKIKKKKLIKKYRN